LSQYFDLVKKMSFLRNGGTDDELRAANILLEEIEKGGGKGELMDFQIPYFNLEKYSMKVVAPYEQEIETLPYGRSGCLPEGGVDLKLYYAERGVAEDYVGIDDLSDTVVLLNELHLDMYRLLCEKNAAAFMVIQGKWWNNSENSDFLQRHLREEYETFPKKIPGFYIWAKDATELIRNKAEVIHLELRETEYDATSRNVLATIPGTRFPEESIVITAHYDSVLVGSGAWDNATGSAAIMYIYHHFLKNPPLRTLRFVWCGAEEQGLLGSKAYIEKYPEIVKQIKFCFNFDMCGTVLGPNSVFVTGGDDLKHYAEQYCGEVGMRAAIHVGVHSSDSAPFADKGIPSLGLSRGTRTAEIHTRNDQMFPLSAEQLEKDSEFAYNFISKMANAVRLPVATSLDDKMKAEVDKYFAKDKIYKKEDEEKK